jgi:hypothetical protein
MKWGIRLFALAERDTVLIPDYGRLTGNVCNLPYSENPFISRIVLSLMDRLVLVLSGIEDYHHFADRYCSSVELAQELYNRKCKYTFGFFFNLWPCAPTFRTKQFT